MAQLTNNFFLGFGNNNLIDIHNSIRDHQLFVCFIDLNEKLCIFGLSRRTRYLLCPLSMWRLKPERRFRGTFAPEGRLGGEIFHLISQREVGGSIDFRMVIAWRIHFFL